MPEKRIVLQNCLLIDPNDIRSFLKRDGFRAWEKIQNGMTPEQIIEEIKLSGLRGRGGAGFPCGLKWEMARQSSSTDKYVICNADEGEVGTFKDRYILQNDPFTLIEAIAIACYAIGARQAYIYLRMEYHYLLDSLKEAIHQAKKTGLIDHLDIDIYEGAGAYICGEESALMESIEGKRGEVRYRPPFPPSRGLWGEPTIINNVETLMNIPRIIVNGAQWFSEIGTERSKGTKVFSVSGDVDKPGVYEMILGSSLQELVVELAGAENVKMVQVGGATGRIVPYSLINTPLSFETIMGAGAITVYNNSRDVIDIVHRTLEFLVDESCGKCSPCREGTKSMNMILKKFQENRGAVKDIKLLEELASAMALSSLCGLGQAAPIPVTDTLQHFRSDYESRIR